jgi:hypothetical protein
MDNDIFDFELNNTSLRCSQPLLIKKQLKPHQLACIYKAIKMENEGTVNYNITDESYRDMHVDVYRGYQSVFTGNVSISTNIGILGDIVGYGKTLTALSIVAHNPLNNIHINKLNTYSFHSYRAYNYFTVTSSNKNIPNLNNMINSTLIIVPRGPVYVQWEKTLKENTELKYLAIDNLNYIKKNLPGYDKDKISEIIDFFNQYDVVLIKNTTINSLFDYYQFHYNKGTSFINKWKRIMIDECHDIITKIDIFQYLYLWLISGTYMNLCNKTSSSHSLYYNIKDILRDDYINYMLVKCNRSFVKESFQIPEMIEKYYLCKLSRHLQIIKNYISPTILEKINANDISGAVKELGGKNETEEGIVKLICSDLNKDISNKIKEKEYVSSLDIPEESKTQKLKNIDTEINILNEKLHNLKERITEIENKTCAICIDTVFNPIILECAHIFCGSCLMNWLNMRNKKCPECRSDIKSLENLTAVVSKENLTVDPVINEDNHGKIGKGLLSKDETLLEIIKNKNDGKFLVFSRVDNGFVKIIEKLKSSDISFAELKGNTSHMMNVLNNFKNGQIKVILLNTQYAGSGIDISCATDVIIYHSMDIDKQQAIGRAQRVGRTDKLLVHNLCYDHEMF